MANKQIVLMASRISPGRASRGDTTAFLFRDNMASDGPVFPKEFFYALIGKGFANRPWTVEFLTK